MSVNIAPKGRDSIEITQAVYVDQLHTLPTFDYQGIGTAPNLPRSKRMPDVGFVYLRTVRISGHFRVLRVFHKAVHILYPTHRSRALAGRIVR